MTDNDRKRLDDIDDEIARHPYSGRTRIEQFEMLKWLRGMVRDQEAIIGDLLEDSAAYARGYREGVASVAVEEKYEECRFCGGAGIIYTIDGFDCDHDVCPRCDGYKTVLVEDQR